MTARDLEADRPGAGGRPGPAGRLGAGRYRRRLLAGALAAAGLPACGFQLRRSAALPFRTLYAGFSPTSAIGAQFRTLVRMADDTELVDDPARAEARLEVLNEQRERDVIVFSATGRPREYQLRLRFTFRVLDAASRERLPRTELVLSRDMISTDIEIVAKQQEEELLFRDMESDLAQQLLRRLSAIPPSP
ncbi:MAG: LPS assembly lipoprotein LptE [Burkholderiaceae bacterium]